MIKVIIESPYKGDVEFNTLYARRCVRDSVLRGEAPIASHLLFTQPGILNDDIPEERKMGIEAGLAWSDIADFHVFYTDLGWSSGMLAALHMCFINSISSKLRALFSKVKIPAILDESIEALIRRNIDEA